MFEFIDILPRKLQFLIAGVLIIGNVLLLSVLASEIQARQVHASSADSLATPSLFEDSSSNPNVVTRGFSAAAESFAQVSNSAERTFVGGISAVGSVGTFFVHSGKSIVSSVHFSARSTARTLGGGVLSAGRALGDSFSFTTRIISNSAVFIVRAPVTTLGLITHNHVVSTIVRPGENAPVPTINSKSPSQQSTAPATQATTPVKPAHKSSPKAVPAAQWPIHGTITTLFGVPEWPYEPIHTGLDISDGKSPGITPIHPFKAGRVIAAIHSDAGLGNHVIVDNGGGLTSVYGHLHAISVHVGQQVNQHTILGYEGSTGASTGTHLHFEIRVNGQPMDPHKFIHGQP